MLLSEAIILGDTLKQGDANRWLTDDGSCGCAFGGALIAIGLSDSYREEARRVFPGFCLEPNESISVMSALPWITEEILDNITDLYAEVRRQKATIEDVAAYVRTVEPPEAEQPQAEMEPVHTELA